MIFTRGPHLSHGLSQLVYQIIGRTGGDLLVAVQSNWSRREMINQIVITFAIKLGFLGPCLIRKNGCVLIRIPPRLILTRNSINGQMRPQAIRLHLRSDRRGMNEYKWDQWANEHNIDALPFFC